MFLRFVNFYGILKIDCEGVKYRGAKAIVTSQYCKITIQLTAIMILKT